MHPGGFLAVERDVIAGGFVRDRGPRLALETRAQAGGALRAAGNVVADMHHAPRPRRRREHRVERRDAPRLGRRHAEPRANVLKSTFGDESDAGLQRLKRREQQVPPLTRGAAAELGGVRVARASPIAAIPG